VHRLEMEKPGGLACGKEIAVLDACFDGRGSPANASLIHVSIKLVCLLAMHVYELGLAVDVDSCHDQTGSPSRILPSAAAIFIFIPRQRRHRRKGDERTPVILPRRIWASACIGCGGEVEG
jgi:hypothetical protein